MRYELVTSLKRRATEILADLREHRDPVLVTEHGRPAAYLVDVGTFEEMQRRISVLEGIALGERDVREGNALTQAQVEQRMAKWLK